MQNCAMGSMIGTRLDGHNRHGDFINYLNDHNAYLSVSDQEEFSGSSGAF